MSNEPLIGQLRDPTAATVSTGKWLAETEKSVDEALTQDVPQDVAFIVAGTDVERTARKLVQDGTAMQVMEHVLALYGLRLERSEDANMVIELQSLHGSLWFREYYLRDPEGNVSMHGKPVAEIPGWVMAFIDATHKSKEVKTCYVCEQEFKASDKIVPHRHPITGAVVRKHAEDCML